MRKTNYTNRFKTVTTRPFKKIYYVDIQIDNKDKNNEIVDFYLWNVNYSTKMHMFGLFMNDLKNLYNNFKFQCQTQKKLEDEDKEIKELIEINRNVIPYAINMIVEPQINKYIEMYRKDYEDEE